MLVQLGKRNHAVDTVDLLYECHGRIRRFLEIAMRLAKTREPQRELVHDTAGQVRRYFAEALPLHIADEDELVISHLRGRSEEIDDALDKMHREHVHHGPLIDRLIEVCMLLEREPARIDDLAIELRDVTALLQTAFEPHLAREETILFPALRALPASAREAIKSGMRERREGR